MKLAWCQCYQYIYREARRSPSEAVHHSTLTISEFCKKLFSCYIGQEAIFSFSWFWNISDSSTKLGQNSRTSKRTKWNKQTTFIPYKYSSRVVEILTFRCWSFSFKKILLFTVIIFQTETVSEMKKQSTSFWRHWNKILNKCQFFLTWNKILETILCHKKVWFWQIGIFKLKKKFFLVNDIQLCTPSGRIAMCWFLCDCVHALGTKSAMGWQPDGLLWF